MDEITDLSHYINGRHIFSAVPQPHDLHYDMAMMGAGGMIFRSDSTTGTGSTTASLSAGGGLEIEIGGGGNCRWPRQETLTLLEVRSSLDFKFKEANQKGPLWDEVSRIMSEEHGYQRSGKKCREKFENLYKYYKKTKEGKAGRQDGKHYRFFRQLEALYGGTSTNNIPNPPHLCDFQAHPQQQLFKPAAPCDSPSLSNTFDTCSSGYKSDCVDKTTSKRRFGWKTKIKELVDVQMNKVMEKQEEWMEKMMRSIEQKERERVLREEQWRKEEAARFEKEHKFWANERAWMEYRDSALMEALQRLNGKELQHKFSPTRHNISDKTLNLTAWGENELTRLIHLRTTMEARFEEHGMEMEELLWEEVASKMASMGYNRNGVTCKTKWDDLMLLKTKNRKENTRSSNSYTHQNKESLSHIFHQQPANYHQRLVAPNDDQNDCSHRFLLVDHQIMLDGYGIKLRMGDDH